MLGEFSWWKAGQGKTDLFLRSLSNMKVGIARRTKIECYFLSVIG